MAGIFQRLSSKISNLLSKYANEESSTGFSSTNQSSSTIQIIYCRFCGKDNPASSEYCLQCRRQITISPSRVMKVCEKCGLAVNNDSAYCYSCGTILFNGVSSEYCLQRMMPIKVPPSQVMKVCEKCGLAVNNDSAYCYGCGTTF